MIPYARKLRTRLVLVNRRDYPGAQPYSEQARRLLSPGTADPDALRSSMSCFMKDRALEFAAFLAGLVQEGGIAPAQRRRNAGGIVLVGWSMGGLWMTAFLAHISSSPYGQTLRRYVRRIIIYGEPLPLPSFSPRVALVHQAVVCADTPSTTLGYPRPENIFDAFMLAMQGDRRFLTSDWFSGYFAHGRTVDTLEYKTPLLHPPPTQSTLSPAERESLSAREPVSRGGSDQILAFEGYRSGLFREIWESALYLNPRSPPQSGVEVDGVGRAGAARVAEESAHWHSQWEDVEVRHVWCDMSFWETPHAALMIQAELADARAHGRRVRDVASVRLRGMNHFVSRAPPSIRRGRNFR